MVSTRGDDGRAWSNASDFEVADDALRARAAALRPAPDAPVARRVVYATWLDQQGLHDEARPYWQALAREFPRDARLQVVAGD
jgi:hypothetical protein